MPRRFLWLWAKCVTAINPACHCTNCLRGAYSTRFSAHNPAMADPVQRLDEPQRRPWSAIHLCGVIRRGYPTSNYPHNLHAALVPAPGQTASWQFEDWTMTAEDAVFTTIPDLADLTTAQRELPERFTSCRIFRWAMVHGQALARP